MLSYTDPALTPAEATAYHAASGAAGWPADASVQAQAIMRGQRYLGARYNARWLTEWDSADAPDPVKHAIAEAALIEARKPGALSPVSTPATDKVLTAAGKLQWERVKGAGGADSYVPRSAIIDGLLAGLVNGATGSTTFLLRV